MAPQPAIPLIIGVTLACLIWAYGIRGIAVSYAPDRIRKHPTYMPLGDMLILDGQSGHRYLIDHSSTLLATLEDAWLQVGSLVDKLFQSSTA